ncbi:OmpA family protein [Shimia sediminis]|uniref:OmpA family protein n=1 Tax=Shimia sediminis TaxID=2497945 RepID=UPI000F8D5BB3|nr:OmpA family protein [Shimia sediminis]
MKTLAALFLAFAPVAGLAFEPDLPAGARQLIDESRTRATYELPLGPYRNGAMPIERVRGLVRLQSWRIEGQPDTVTEIAEVLAAQLSQSGYDLVFQCQTEDCGGFDFRFETLVMPPPDMFVNLSNFRFLSARRDSADSPEAVGVLLSNTTSAAMVQIISATPMDPVQLDLVESRDREADESAQLEAATLGIEDSVSETPKGRGNGADTDKLIEMLLDRGHVVLGGLNFQTGSANLTDGPFASLETLAEWLNQDATRRVALVGHTDSEGALDTNVTLSHARAVSVQDHLVSTLGVPAAQLEAHGIGFLAPLASNAEAEGRNTNRRVEAVLISTP